MSIAYNVPIKYNFLGCSQPHMKIKYPDTTIYQLLLHHRVHMDNLNKNMNRYLSYYITTVQLQRKLFINQLGSLQYHEVEPLHVIPNTTTKTSWAKEGQSIRQYLANQEESAKHDTTLSSQETCRRLCKRTQRPTKWGRLHWRDIYSSIGMNSRDHPSSREVGQATNNANSVRSAERNITTSKD